VTGSRRFPFPVFRFLVLLLFLSAAASSGPAQTRSPAPPPAVDRAAFRSHWFEIQNAVLEGDVPSARAALAALTRSARAIDVRRLADYSRMAVHEGRKAERAGRLGSAWLGYEAAVTLDDSSFDAAASRAGFLVRRGRLREALGRIPEAAATFARSAELRLSLASAAATAVGLALAAGAVAFSLAVFLRYFRRIVHDFREVGGRPFGQRAAAPIAFVLLLLPLLLTFGPVWLVLYWAAVAYSYATRRERIALAALLVALGLVPLLVEVVARENLQRRTPVHLAAIDLAERRDDASVEDALAAYAAARPEEPEVWFLLARYAERVGDRQRALAAYGRAIEADPDDYRAYVNRGNVRFADGDYPEAIGDYEEATRRAPDAVEAFYNLSVARSEIYDFKGQERARARALQISPRDVDAWSSKPPPARVVAAQRHAIRESPRRENPKPRNAASGAGPLAAIPFALRGPATLAPWGALLVAVLVAAIRSGRAVAIECTRCGRAFCRLCKRYGGPTVYCGRCARITRGGEDVEEIREADRLETRARAARRRWTIRAASLALPGVHRLVAGRPAAAAATFITFFLAIALAAGGPWFFEIRPLAPAEAGLPFRLAAVSVALALWLGALAGAWRQTREP
jgi:tetratricopeptide (TPR) repeat protein